MKFKDSDKCSNLVSMRTSIIDPDPEQPRENNGFLECAGITTSPERIKNKVSLPQRCEM
jgi:hypothetical protein